MTARSRRREAELAVIEAASKLVRGQRHLWVDDIGPTLRRQLVEAVDALGALDLEVPDAVRTGDNNPCLTSSEAAEWMRDKAGDLAGRVFVAILKAHRGGGTGLTTEQVERALGGKHQTVSPRVTELRDKGFIVDSGFRRLTASGRKAIVWTPTAVAAEVARANNLDLPWSWS
jgi:hypothetical protein